MLPKLRWRIALLVSVAIAISYLDRQTLPWAIKAIQTDIPISNEALASLSSAFLVTYGLMYLGGGRLLDYLGTRRGFTLVMIFWSLACASHGLAGNYGLPAVLGLAAAVVMLGASRLLLGIGEGGGFPAATRAVTEWFPVNERSTAMGIINAGTAIGAVVAPPLIVWILTHVNWFGLAPWRWVFFITGSFGLVWTIWWRLDYFPPEKHPGLNDDQRAALLAALPARAVTSTPVAGIPLLELLRHREVWGVVFAKFLSDAAWFFYIFWLPKFLLDQFNVDLKTASDIGWIPYAASGVGCLVGGSLSSRLLHRGSSVNRARKFALGASAALMPWVMLVPQLDSVNWVIFIFSLAFFGQQSWSTLVMILPTDLIPRQSVGTVAGLVGLGGSMGGIVLNMFNGWMLDHGYGYGPALIVASSLHLLAFAVICLAIPTIRPLNFSPTPSA